ncbi:MAG: hypothetical protein M3N53_13335 [Actinomycetota bacterium]|nr:hypothetical protein [Actinomycetota bacterium]
MPLILRSLLVTTIAASMIAISASARAHHQPNVYCSESGDLCQSARKVDRVRKLRIVTAARYFEVFDLCVYSHREDYECCAPYRLRPRADGTFGRSVAWFKQWPSMRGPGAFTVTWRVDGTRIGKRLGFHVR